MTAYHSASGSPAEDLFIDLLNLVGHIRVPNTELLKPGVTDLKQHFPEETVTLDGTDITATVNEAWDFLVAHSFAL